MRSSRLTVMLSLLLLLGLVFGAPPAAAAVLFAGTEDIDFTCESGATCTVDTSGGGTNYRSAWVRSAYTVSGSGATNDPPTNRFSTPVFTASGTTWTHFQFLQATGTDANAQLVRFVNDAGNANPIIRGTGSAGQVKISTRTAGGSFADLATCAGGNLPSGGLQQIDIKVVYGVSGEVTLYSGGTQFCTFSGDITNGDGATTIEQVTLAGLASAQTAYYSEVAVADADTRDSGVLSLYPNAAGTLTEWTPSNACTTIWNATAFNDSLFASSANDGETQQCAVFNTIPSGIWTVDAVVMSTRAARSATGPQNFNYVTRTGGTDYYSGDISPATSFGNHSNYLQATNPDTSAAWTTSDLTAAGFNIGLISKP